MAVYSGQILLRINRSYNGNTYNSDVTLNFNTSSVSSSSIGFASNYDYTYLGCRLISLLKDGSGISTTDVAITIGLEGRCSGGFLIPFGSPTSGVSLSGGISLISETPQVVFATAFSGSDVPVDISANGFYYEDSNGNWLKVSDNSLVATAQEVSNLPQNVDFNGWLVEHEIIEGDDGNYYDLGGNELFHNLPSGVIPVSQIIAPVDDGSGNLEDGVFEGSDGNYYNVSGDEVLGNLPSGITPVSQIGDVIVGSDGDYYDLQGNSVMENLPSDVTIVGYDDNTDSYIGSDGKHYDVDGDEVTPTPSCDGELLQYSNIIRLVVDCEDIFGNQVSFSSDVTVGTASLRLSTANVIRKINRVVARNINSGVSCGNGNLRIRGDIVGAKIGLDWEGYDIDAVLGTYDVCNCVFDVCNKYANYVYNEDLPLGFSTFTALDVGYYCMTDTLLLSWEGFDSSEFPYCCHSYNETVNEGGSLGKDDNRVSVDWECVCDNLELLNNNLVSKLQLINDTISHKFEALIQAINDKECSVTVEGDEINVEPSEVTVTNPVNNITVSPCEPVVSVTNPVNNITVQSAVPDITVSPCEPTIQNVINEGDCINDNSDLIECLECIFKKGDDTITDIVDDVFKTTYQGLDGEMHTEDITEVIRNKQCENVVECIVEPVNMAYEGKGKYIDKDMLEQN